MKSILVIEDDDVLRENISLILESEGYSVTKCLDGETGIKEIEKTKYDLVLCDIMMPQMDGYDVLKSIKYLKSPPAFVFLTAKTERQDWRKGMELGADDFITKPFTRQEVLNAIEVQLSKREAILKKFNMEKEMLNLLKNKITVDDKIASDLKYEGNIFLSDSNKSDFIKISSILYLSAAKDYTKIFTKEKKTFIVRKPMKVWESKLPKDHFLRIHRSTIINTEYIDKVEKWFNYSHKLYLKDIKDFFIISQRYSRKFKKQITKM
jgi:DNA-binding LytR/AlgR family response regulator